MVLWNTLTHGHGGAMNDMSRRCSWPRKDSAELWCELKVTGLCSDIHGDYCWSGGEGDKTAFCFIVVGARWKHLREQDLGQPNSQRHSPSTLLSSLCPLGGSFSIFPPFKASE